MVGGRRAALALLLAARCAGGAPEPIAADLGQAEPDVASFVTGLLEAARAAPREAERRVDLGMAYEMNGLPEAALRCYEQAVAIEPSEPRWRYYLALAQADAGALETALATIGPVLTAAPTEAPPWLWRGEWLLDLGRVDEAAEAFEQARKLAPDAPAAFTGLARVELRRGQPLAAIRTLEPIAAATPDPRVRQILGLAYRAAGDLERARIALAAGGPNDAPRWRDPWRERKSAFRAGFGAGLIRAQELLAGGRVAEAVEIFERLRTQRPDDLALLNNLSVAYRGAGREDDSLQVLLDGVARHPDYFPFHINLGAAYQRRGDAARALEHLDRAIAIKPTLAEAHSRKGVLLYRLGRLEEAIRVFDTALRYDAASVASLLYSGAIAADLGRWGDAEGRLDRAIGVDPSQPIAWVVLARTKGELGKRVEARAALDRAAALGAPESQIESTRRRLDEIEGGRR